METADSEAAKVAAARKGLSFVEEGMVVGLGSGTTATQFIKLLGERVKQGFKVRGIPSSRASEALAAAYSIPLTDFQECAYIDVTIDGADEIGPGLALIKGGGGALLREKIVASVSKRFIVVADSRKVVSHLGKFPLPVEVIQMASPIVERRLQDLGIHPSVRTQDGKNYITDEGNLILDCAAGQIDDPERLAAQIRSIVGVVEHGLFLNMASMALVAEGANVNELHP